MTVAQLHSKEAVGNRGTIGRAPTPVRRPRGRGEEEHEVRGVPGARKGVYGGLLRDPGSPHEVLITNLAF